MPLKKKKKKKREKQKSCKNVSVEVTAVTRGHFFFFESFRGPKCAQLVTWFQHVESICQMQLNRWFIKTLFMTRRTKKETSN